jgi:hypothetical protein
MADFAVSTDHLNVSMVWHSFDNRRTTFPVGAKILENLPPRGDQRVLGNVRKVKQERGVL